MRLTKYEHSCVLVEVDDARVLIDPGSYSHGFESLTGLTCVLVTHQHADHVDAERLKQLLATNPGARVAADVATAVMLAEAGIQTTALQPGERLDVGTTIEVSGGEHAVIHPEVPVIPNIAVLVGGRFFHPGDSFTVPSVRVDVLGLPSSGPWLKVSEAIDYLRAVAPRVAIPIHEAAATNPAMAFTLFGKLAPEGTDVQVVQPGSQWES